MNYLIPDPSLNVPQQQLVINPLEKSYKNSIFTHEQILFLLILEKFPKLISAENFESTKLL